MSDDRPSKLDGIATGLRPRTSLQSYRSHWLSLESRSPVALAILRLRVSASIGDGQVAPDPKMSVCYLDG